MLGPRQLNRGWWMWRHQKIFPPLAKQIEFFSRAQNLTCCDGSPTRLWRLKWSLSDYRRLSASQVSISTGASFLSCLRRSWSEADRDNAGLLFTPEMWRQRQTSPSSLHQHQHWLPTVCSEYSEMFGWDRSVSSVITYYANGRKLWGICRLWR